MRRTVPLLLFPVLVACGGGRAAGPDPAATEAALEDRAGYPADSPGEYVKSFDLNRDDSPDVFHHFARSPSGKDRLVRKDMDINWDGRIDIWRWYDAKERVEREEFDLDFDGRIDVMNVYDEEGRLVRKEADLDFNGKADLWKHYEGGKLVRKERDTSGDGRVDYWEYYENGEVDRIGEDLDGDGTVDRWKKL